MKPLEHTNNVLNSIFLGYVQLTSVLGFHNFEILLQNSDNLPDGRSWLGGFVDFRCIVSGI